MTRLNRIYMVRHGRASAGWDTALDPGLDELGQAQAREAANQLQSLPIGNIITSPLLRCQQTSVPLAQMWNVVPQVCAEVSEIPSPKGVAMSDRIVWLRQAIACHVSQLTDTSFLGNMSPEIFQMTFGHEWFTKTGESGPPRDAWLFD